MLIPYGRKYIYDVYWTNAGTGETRVVEVYKVEGVEEYHSSEGNLYLGQLPTIEQLKTNGYLRGPFPTTHMRR